MSKYVALLLAITSAANAASLGDVKHVIMLMMENRSFQHVIVVPGEIFCLRQQNSSSIFWPLQYFGTMSGVRGFADPNVAINPDGKSVWYQ